MRNTAAKTEIMEVIANAGKALSHSEVQGEMQGNCDRVTIYRVLDRLCEEGMVHKVVNIDGVLKYAACHRCSAGHQHNHAHFSCEKCKEVTCLDNVEPVIKLPVKYKVSDMNITIAGVCPQCG